MRISLTGDTHVPTFITQIMIRKTAILILLSSMALFAQGQSTDSVRIDRITEKMHDAGDNLAYSSAHLKQSVSLTIAGVVCAGIAVFIVPASPIIAIAAVVAGAGCGAGALAARLKASHYLDWASDDLMRI